MKRLVLIALALAVASVPAFAATRQEHHFKLAFSAKTTQSQSGVTFLTDRFDYKAPAQGQIADRVATTTFVMATGTRTNANGYPACSKSALTERGPMACPSGSRVGTGKAVVITGLPIDPITMTAQIFTTHNGLLTYLTGSGQTQVIGLSMKGNRMVAAVPRKCLVPSDCTQGEAVLKKLTITLTRGKLITTPAKCPASHKWTNTVLYKYVNGDTEKETSTSPCKG